MKKLKKYLYLFSFLFLFFIPKAHATIIVPTLPFDETQTNYVMSYWGSVNKMYLTYCKGSNQRLTIKTSVGQNVYSTAIGYCYGPNGEYYGYAYRRGLNATLTNEEINDYDFELSGEWGEELQSNSYQTPISYIPSEEKLAIYSDYTYNPPDNYDNDAVIISGNTDIYDTDYTTILLSQEDYSPTEPVEDSCDLKPIGVIKNIDSFTFEVNGIGNALNVPLKGQFAFVGRGGTPLLTNNYNVSVSEKNNEDIDGSYQFQCNDEDIGNGCLFKYEYNYIDDIDTPLTLQFTFTSKTGQLDYEYSLYSCNFNNSKVNYTYIDKIGGNNQIVENPSLENSIGDDNVSESDNFLTDNIINNEAFRQDHGLAAIIQAPITFLESLNNKTCSSIVLPIPYLGNATIPCMSSIYSTKFSALYNILKIVINGVLCYRIALSVVMIVKGAKDPNDDKIEVMDL